MITRKTTAIIPVHVYGNLCDIDAINEVATKYHLKVIYDAAHAFGVEKDNQSIGCFGDITMFSFHATKVFNTIEGGALCYKNPELTPILYNLKNFGITSPETVEDIGTNAKMNEFQAAMGICNLRHLDNQILQRKKIYDKYLEELSGIRGLKLSYTEKNTKSNYAYFPIIIEPELFGKDRNMVAEELSINNVFVRKYFYPLINDYSCYRSIYSSEATPIAKRIANQVLTLPIYPDLGLDDVNRICKIIKGK